MKAVSTKGKRLYCGWLSHVRAQSHVHHSPTLLYSG